MPGKRLRHTCMGEAAWGCAPGGSRPMHAGDAPCPWKTHLPLELIPMAQKPHLICCRLSDEDLAALKEHAQDLELSNSDYLRFLIRIPVTPEGIAIKNNCISLDVETVGRIYGELVRWGRHYNQAVKALNTIARQVRSGRIDDTTVTELLEKANTRLEQTDAGRKEVLDQMYRIEALTLVGG